MKKERENLELLLICMVIGIIAACITGYFLYENKKEYWEVQARDTFHEALTEEMQKRSGIEVFFSTKGNIHLSVVDSVDKKKEPITVFMETEYGKKNFVIPYEKHTKPSCGTLLSEKRCTAYMMPAQAACVTLTGNMEIPTYGRMPIIKDLPTPTRFSPGSFTPNK